MLYNDDSLFLEFYDEVLEIILYNGSVAKHHGFDLQNVTKRS